MWSRQYITAAIVSCMIPNGENVGSIFRDRPTAEFLHNQPSFHQIVGHISEYFRLVMGDDLLGDTGNSAPGHSVMGSDGGRKNTWLDPLSNATPISHLW